GSDRRARWPSAVRGAAAGGAATRGALPAQSGTIHDTTWHVYVLGSGHERRATDNRATTLRGRARRAASRTPSARHAALAAAGSSRRRRRRACGRVTKGLRPRKSAWACLTRLLRSLA